ncbi:MAG: hypothetical protein KAU35_10685 [candidate division Zixibacteria bacterium]|nr:hypothetical protein [candidate division Zixibacteria bacterium]
MKLGPRLISRIALFSALIYVLSMGAAYLPNVNLIFFLVFSAGFLWGAVPGLLVGSIGMWLWTSFNPFGPAALPLALTQVGGAAASGIVGAVFRRSGWRHWGRMTLTIWLIVAAVVCTAVFYLPVSAVDAWLFQPFWPRFLTSLLWSGVSLVSNVLIFPLLFGVVRYLYERENAL